MNMLPQRLKIVRKSLRLTQEEVAKRASTTIANISGYESGNQSPSASMLYRLSKALDCSVDYLFGLSDTPALSVQEDNLRQMSVQELMEHYVLVLSDGKVLKSEEIEEMVKYILAKTYDKKGKIKKQNARHNDQAS